MSKNDIVLVAPAVETLLNQDEGFWPQNVIRDPRLKMHADLRHAFRQALDRLWETVPDPTQEIVAALDRGMVDPHTYARAYELGADFLAADPEHARLVLYFPFELIPYADFAVGRGGIDRFMEKYLSAWRALLGESDIRANFVNGDILEPELAPAGQPRVVKAAHLIPELARKGWLSEWDIAPLRSSADAILEESIADAQAFRAETPDSQVTLVRSLGELQKEIEAGVRAIEGQHVRDIMQGLPLSRITWLDSDRREALVAKWARVLRDTLIRTRGISFEEVASLISPFSSPLVRAASIAGLGETARILNHADPSSAYALVARMLARFHSVKTEDYAPVLMHLYHDGLVTHDDLRHFELAFPDFTSGLDPEGRVAKDIAGLEPVVRALSEDPGLRDFVHPVAVFYGSRLKGYARRDADLDAAVFVKPGTDFRMRTVIQERLAHLFGRTIVEFWLERRDGGLDIRDFPNPDGFLADSYWVHIPLAGVWLGREDAVRELYETLLARFLLPHTSRLTHTRRLREMERDALQYRLMHKGYHRFFPPAGGIEGPDAMRLGPGAFWDSGFRRLGTRLFVTRVFLPELSPKS